MSFAVAYNVVPQASSSRHGDAVLDATPQVRRTALPVRVRQVCARSRYKRSHRLQVKAVDVDPVDRFVCEQDHLNLSVLHYNSWQSQDQSGVLTKQLFA